MRAGIEVKRWERSSVLYICLSGHQREGKERTGSQKIQHYQLRTGCLTLLAQLVLSFFSISLRYARLLIHGQLWLLLRKHGENWQESRIECRRYSLDIKLGARLRSAFSHKYKRGNLYCEPVDVIREGHYDKVLRVRVYFICSTRALNSYFKL